MCCVEQPVGADERHLLEILDGRFGRRPTPSSRRSSAPSRSPRSVSSAASARKSDSKNTRSNAIAEPRERLALAGDHPGARLEPQLERLRVALQHPLSNSSAASSCISQLARQRVLRLLLAVARRRRRSLRSRRSRDRRNGRSSRRRPAMPARARPLSRRPAIASPMLRPTSEIRLRRSTRAAGLRRARRRARCRSRDCAGARRAAPWSCSRPRTAPSTACPRRGRRAALGLPPASRPAPVVSTQPSASRRRTSPPSRIDLRDPRLCPRSARAPPATRRPRCQAGVRGTSFRS